MNRAITLAVSLSIATAAMVACGDSEEEKAADFFSVVASTATAQQTIVALLNSGEAPPPDEVKSSLATFRARLSELSSAAPEELAAAMILVVNGFTAFDLGLQKVDYDYMRLLTDPAAAELAQADMAALDAPATQDALAAVDDYSLANCGIALDLSGD